MNEFLEILNIVCKVLAKCPKHAVAMLIPLYFSLFYITQVVLHDKTWAVQALYALMAISISSTVSLTLVIAIGKF
ncbi:MAG: hypothetical protein HUU50_00685 [Candidatus Brocadiae bacterium]|nr:hypothetical protein [Candidatus Brocadiia bacterium]